MYWDPGSYTEVIGNMMNIYNLKHRERKQQQTDKGYYVSNNAVEIMRCDKEAIDRPTLDGKDKSTIALSNI